MAKKNNKGNCSTCSCSCSEPKENGQSVDNKCEKCGHDHKEGGACECGCE